MVSKQILIGILIGLFFSVIILVLPDLSTQSKSEIFQAHVQHIEMLGAKYASFDEFSSELVNIARVEGGVYAFEVLKQAKKPFGLDTHLLGHYIGEELYRQQGISGMQYCTHDFRNACSHTMVIGALQDSGVAALTAIRQACVDAPGGSGAYTMCFHGLGHGVLAYNGYDMEKTIQMCRLFGTDAYAKQETVECFGGAIMEIIGGGGHDANLWEVQRKEYLKSNAPFGFCESVMIPDNLRDICYTYMTPFAYEAAGADMQSPNDAVLKEVFGECEKIELVSNRKSCFGGQGKEFIGFATGRDFSNQGILSSPQLQEMRRMCALTEVEDGYRYCIEAVVDSLYWGGENDFFDPLSFCNLKHPDHAKAQCYEELTRVVDLYSNDTDYKAEYCRSLPNAQQESCMQTIVWKDS